ncbi:sugar ABC transporter permease [Streptomyces tanashiensis]
MTLTAPQAPAPPRAAPPPRPGTARRAWRTVSPYAYLAPFFTLFAAFGLFPLLYTAFVSLYRVELQTPGDMEWRGLGNYTALLGDEYFRVALRNTFTIGVLSTVPQLVMALGLAHLLNYRMRGRTFLRTAVLLPYATSVAAATLVFAQLFGRDFGLINYGLGLVGVDPVDWQNDTVASQIAVSTVVIWRWTGYNALIYLAGMQSIPDELYDGRRDGRRLAVAPVLPRHTAGAAAHHPLHRHRLHDRRHPALRRAAAPRRVDRGRQLAPVPDARLYMYEQGRGLVHLGRPRPSPGLMFLSSRARRPQRPDARRSTPAMRPIN